MKVEFKTADGKTSIRIVWDSGVVEEYADGLEHPDNWVWLEGVLSRARDEGRQDLVAAAAKVATEAGVVLSLADLASLDTLLSRAMKTRLEAAALVRSHAQLKERLAMVDEVAEQQVMQLSERCAILAAAVLSASRAVKAPGWETYDAIALSGRMLSQLSLVLEKCDGSVARALSRERDDCRDAFVHFASLLGVEVPGTVAADTMVKVEAALEKLLAERNGLSEILGRLGADLGITSG